MLFPDHTCLWSSILTVASVVARSSDLKGNFASYLFPTVSSFLPFRSGLLKSTCVDESEWLDSSSKSLSLRVYLPPPFDRILWIEISVFSLTYKSI